MATFRFEVVVEVERESGKFASRDEISEMIVENLSAAAEEEISGIGADGESVYAVTDVSVEAK